MNNRIYFDNAATTKPKQEVVDYAIEIMKNYWENPNSICENGLNARMIIENARENVANKINAKPNEIIFCPTASAANSLAILGYLKRNKVEKFITTNIEHDSILDINIPFFVKKEIIKCDQNGIINTKLLTNFKNSLVSVIGANNEIGTIQCLKEISDIAHKNGCIFHSDLTQYIPYIPVDVEFLGLDMATFSAHKLGGIRGCAVLYVRDGIDLEPLVYGHQEQGLMAGTENTVAIAAMGKAMELLDYSSYRDILDMRNYLLCSLIEIDNKILVNGSLYDRLYNNLNIYIHDLGISNQQLISLLDIGNIQVSASSACNAGSNDPSHVLMAMYDDEYRANHSIRITLSKENTKEEIDKFVECLKNIIEMYKI